MCFRHPSDRGDIYSMTTISAINQKRSSGISFCPWLTRRVLLYLRQGIQEPKEERRSSLQRGWLDCN